jgi:hypothetical protein
VDDVQWIRGGNERSIQLLVDPEDDKKTIVEVVRSTRYRNSERFIDGKYVFMDVNASYFEPHELANIWAGYEDLI